MAKKKTDLDPAASRVGEPDPQPLDFEESLSELESIVRRLEQGGGTLEQALGDYSRAIGLMKVCHRKLESAERRIEILSGVDSEGNPIAEALEDTVGASLDEKREARSRRRSASSPERGSQRQDPNETGLF